MALLLVAGVASCAAGPQDTSEDLGVRWVRDAAEYRAITRQVYGTAAAALPGFIADADWSALPGQADAADLPPAVILDVDETVVSNADFQAEFEPPFAPWKLDEWTRNNVARPVEGARRFVEEARRLGVTVFFVTNRPCETRRGNDDPCPQRQTTIEDIAEVGIQTDAEHVLLARERGWTREKATRRAYIAERHRVLLIVGDDYGDFVRCARKKLRAPCTEPATTESRRDALDTYDDYWGNGWYILPNPMHGSWTSID
jgi:acid phosphatase